MRWQIIMSVFFLLFFQSLCARIGNNPMNYVNPLFHLFYYSMVEVYVRKLKCTSSDCYFRAFFRSCFFDHLRRTDLIILNNVGYSQRANGHCENYCHCLQALYNSDLLYISCCSITTTPTKIQISAIHLISRHSKKADCWILQNKRANIIFFWVNFSVKKEFDNLVDKRQSQKKQPNTHTVYKFYKCAKCCTFYIYIRIVLKVWKCVRKECDVYIYIRLLTAIYSYFMLIARS